MIKFKKFKISEVLKWQPQKEIDPLKLSDLSVDNGEEYPFYGQAILNNGIIAYHRLKKDVLNNPLGKPTILIHSNNQDIVYLQTPFYLKDSHGATSVLQSDFLNEKIALYIITAIREVIINKFSYNEKATKIALKNTSIELPVDEKENIDYQYMEEYISKLERECVEKLGSYLSISGLENYELDDVEKNIIKHFEFQNVKSALFRVGDLFDIHPTKSYKCANSKLYSSKGRIPVVSNSSENNGRTGYSEFEPTEKILLHLVIQQAV